MRYGDRFGRVVGIVLLTTLAAMTHAEDAVLDTAAQRALPVERAVVIDHGAFRRLMNGEEGTNKQATSDAAAGILRLTQRTPDKRREWEAALAAPISLDTYPLLVLEYRASNLKIDTSKDAKPLVRIVGTNCNGMAVIKPEQLMADGQPHRIVADLRTLPQYKIASRASAPCLFGGSVAVHEVIHHLLHQLLDVAAAVVAGDVGVQFTQTRRSMRLSSGQYGGRKCRRRRSPCSARKTRVWTLVWMA
jgi:hypothetical protein